ncbi:MAG: 50S ribosomal protein L24 [Longimicrobiales bacterium]|nr:50S ribosomal protein L24 [Longimicrobiales bacterium]
MKHKKTASGKRKQKIVKGDRVRIIRGNDAYHRDAEGRERGIKDAAVLRVLDDDRLVVEGVNMVKRHQRPTQANPDGGIISFEAPIHISNVMLVDPASGDASRVRWQVEEDGTKERIAVKSGNPVPKPPSTR